MLLNDEVKKPQFREPYSTCKASVNAKWIELWLVVSGSARPRFCLSRDQMIPTSIRFEAYFFFR